MPLPLAKHELLDGFAGSYGTVELWRFAHEPKEFALTLSTVEPAGKTLWAFLMLNAADLRPLAQLLTDAAADQAGSRDASAST